MLCILAFIIFLILFPILGFFPSYRQYFRKSWDCVFKKITLKPCDVNLGEELKGKLIGKLFALNPQLAKFFDKTFSFWAFAFVLINIWSLSYVAIAGLNLWVHDTCTPQYAEACALGGDTCSIPVSYLTFEQALKGNQLGDWIAQPFKDLSDTVKRIPDRFKQWKAEDYLSPQPTFYPSNSDKPLALEAIDPLCQFCNKLFKNIKASDFSTRYRLTYVTYPIPDASKPSGYRFANSYMVSSYLEAAKTIKPVNSTNSLSGDWQFLSELFTGRYQDKEDYQYMLNYPLSEKPQEAEQLVHGILIKIGYSQDQVNELKEISRSQQVKDNLAKHRDIVENKIRTVKIPTIIFNGRRFDKVLDTAFLNKN
jgi:hypothetical protein